MKDEVVTIPLDRAVWCASCNHISNTPHSVCPKCGEHFLLFNLARILLPCEETGQITRVRLVP